LEFLLRGKSIEEIRELGHSEEFQRFAALDDKLDSLTEGLQKAALFKKILGSPG
jgi:hypothetical protein